MKTSRRNTRPTWLTRDVTDNVLASFRESFQFSGNLLDLVSQDMPDADMFTDPEKFRAAYWRAEMWSKYPFKIEGIDTEAAAMQSFAEYELRCADANKKLCDLWARPIPEGMRKTLWKARQLMHDLFEEFSLDEVIQHCKWGPGASTSMRRTQATPQNKWVFGSHITEDALPWYYAFQRLTGWVFSRPVIVEGNTVVTVPKNAKTRRTIAIEPDWNMFFQLGLGGAIRRRLQRRFGLLRRDSQQVNQLLAREGSKTGDLATVDLKGASDGVSLALVEALVPHEVFKALVSLRSPKGTLRGQGDTSVTYEKISSMGNGYTFELETAIFYCLVRAASGHAVCYGDDIIVATTAASWTMEVLSFCGFTVNVKKTHVHGPFRESCGGHYFNGVTVTPPYVKKPLVGPKRLTFCNRVSELSDNGHWRDSLGFDVWKSCASGVPEYIQGPITVDGVLHVSRPKVLTFCKGLYTLQGTRVIESAADRESIPIGGYIQALYKGYHLGDDISHSYESESLVKVRYGTWREVWQGRSPWSCCSNTV